MWKLVLKCILPAKPDLTRDDWRAYIHRYLIPEIHAETLRFYGETTSAEALHPGLDYASKRHRLRLEAFPQHRRLFGVLDRLRLTKDEIRSLCKWEGTLLAREVFERQHKLQIEDTTWEGVLPYNKLRPSAYVLLTRSSQRGGSSTPAAAQQLGSDQDLNVEDEESIFEKGDGNAELETEEETQRDDIVDLDRLFMDGNMHAEWEQWMKEALERGAVPSLPGSLHSQALQNFARLSNQAQAQILRGITSTTSPHSMTPTFRQADTDQPRRDSSTHLLDEDAHFSRPSHSPSLRPNPSTDGLHQVVRPPNILSSESQQLAHLSPSSLHDSTSPLSSSVAASQPLDHSGSHEPSFWGRYAPEIFSDYSRSHDTTFQDSLPGLVEYTWLSPSAGVVSATTSGPGPVAPSATPSTSVPS